MVNENKDWEKPELIVLVRNKPEEAVLSACKNSEVSAGYSNYDAGCIREKSAYPWCAACNTTAGS